MRRLTGGGARHGRSVVCTRQHGSLDSCPLGPVAQQPAHAAPSGQVMAPSARPVAGRALTWSPVASQCATFSFNFVRSPRPPICHAAVWLSSSPPSPGRDRVDPLGGHGGRGGPHCLAFEHRPRRRKQRGLTGWVRSVSPSRAKRVSDHVSALLIGQFFSCAPVVQGAKARGGKQGSVQ